MESKLVYLDKKILQKDMRIRLPENLKENLKVHEGDILEIYLDVINNCIVLKKNIGKDGVF